MKDNTDRMDKAIKDKLNGHEAHIPSNLWKSIESKLPPEPTSRDGGFFKNPFIISFLVMSVVITGIYLFRSVNTKEQATTASVAIPAASSNMPIAGNADRYSNSNQNTYTSSVGSNNNTNDSKHASPTGENTYGTQQKISPDGNNHYASKISSNNNSNATNRSIASTPNSSKSSGNNKHTTGINNSDKATQKQTTDQHSTIDQHKGSIEAGTINSNHTHENTSTDKMNASASGAASASKKTYVSTATDNGVAHNNPVIEIPEHPSADSETSQKKQSDNCYYCYDFRKVHNQY